MPRITPVGSIEGSNGLMVNEPTVYVAAGVSADDAILVAAHPADAASGGSGLHLFKNLGAGRVPADLCDDLVTAGGPRPDECPVPSPETVGHSQPALLWRDDIWSGPIGYARIPIDALTPLGRSQLVFTAPDTYVDVFSIVGYDTDTALVVVAIPTETDGLYSLFVPPGVVGVPPDLCNDFPCVSP